MMRYLARRVLAAFLAMLLRSLAVNLDALALPPLAALPAALYSLRVFPFIGSGNSEPSNRFSPMARLTVAATVTVKSDFLPRYRIFIGTVARKHCVHYHAGIRRLARRDSVVRSSTGFLKNSDTGSNPVHAASKGVAQKWVTL